MPSTDGRINENVPAEDGRQLRARPRRSVEVLRRPTIARYSYYLAMTGRGELRGYDLDQPTIRPRMCTTSNINERLTRRSRFRQPSKRFGHFLLRFARRSRPPGAQPGSRRPP